MNVECMSVDQVLLLAMMRNTGPKGLEVGGSGPLRTATSLVKHKLARQLSDRHYKPTRGGVKALETVKTLLRVCDGPPS